VANPGWIHLTARVSRSMPPLDDAEVGAWLWSHLRQAFPGAIAAVLMPDHPHLVLASDEPERDRRRLARMLGQLGRRAGVRGQASEVPPAEPIRGGPVLSRHVRYVALNPCRRGLAGCPLAWPWSTHRDVIGATVDPWVTAVRLAAALGGAWQGFASRHHAYVSAGPHAHVAGTPMPSAAVPTTLPAVGLGTIAEASAAALRVPVTSMRRCGAARALFVALAIDQGWTHVGRLAEVCGCSRRTVHRHAAAVDPEALHAARLCLGDVRLRRGPRVSASREDLPRREGAGGPQAAHGSLASEDPSSATSLE
jgi:hypothetical protein